MDISYRNYFRGYGVLDEWRVEIDRCQRPPLSYFQEVCNNAELIWEQSNGHIYVLFSGGMDSMFVVSVLQHLGMKFTPVIIRLNDDYNFEEVERAFSFCKSLNVKPLALDLDYDKFITSGKLYDYAERTECSVYQMSHVFWAVEQLSGSVVMGECPPNVFYHDASSTFIFEVPRYDFSPVSWWQQIGAGGTPFFLTYTAESLLAILTDPAFHPYFNRKIADNTLDNFKIAAYNNQPHFKIPFVLKKTGLEFFERTPMAQHPEVVRTVQLYKRWGGDYHVIYNTAIQNMAPL